MGWLLEAELAMPEIFRAGSVGADAKAMEEIEYFIRAADILGKGVSEQKIVRFASEKIPAHTVMRVLEIMERSGTLQAISKDEKTGLRQFQAKTVSRE